MPTSGTVRYRCAGLLKRVPFAPLLECRVYCSNDSERSHNISADYQLSVLLALDAAAAGELWAECH